MKTMNLTCSECGGGMTEGFLLDETHGGRQVLRWVEGSPEKSMWVGLKLKNKEVVHVMTYRCTDCGYLKSYARER